jgi:hypothetical protein
MAKRGKHRAPDAGARPPGEPGGAGRAKVDFPIHEHIGRTLKALFDEVAERPVPEKLRELLRELEDKKTKD